MIDVVKALSKKWPGSKWVINQEKSNIKESKLLKLNCDKALSLLNWIPTLSFSTTMELTSSWYYDFYNKIDLNLMKTCRDQIEIFNNEIKN